MMTNEKYREYLIDGILKEQVRGIYSREKLKKYYSTRSLESIREMITSECQCKYESIADDVRDAFDEEILNLTKKTCADIVRWRELDCDDAQLLEAMERCTPAEILLGYGYKGPVPDEVEETILDGLHETAENLAWVFTAEFSRDLPGKLWFDLERGCVVEGYGYIPEHQEWFFKLGKEHFRKVMSEYADSQKEIEQARRERAAA